MNDLSAWLKGFAPAPVLVSRREQIIACVGACVGLLLTAWCSSIVFDEVNPWFIAPMGASAVLLFAVPASPLAQPWSIIGGNLVSAFIGVSCARLIGEPVLAAALAGALAIGAMFALRCLHPPSGAVALTAVLGGPAVASLGYGFVLSPVGVNSAFLLAAALVINNLGRHPYPHHAHLSGNRHGTADPQPAERLGFTRADLDAAIKDYDELLDVSEDDLEAVFRQVELRAYSRRSGEMRCADIMSRDIVVAHPDMTSAQVWQLLERHALHALPVVNEGHGLIGIVTVRDLIAGHPGEAPRVPGSRRVLDIMTRHVEVARPEQSMAELVPLFSDKGFHHLPVVDAAQRLMGMVTQSDLVAALFRKKLDEGVAA